MIFMVHEWQKRTQLAIEDEESIPPISSEDVYGRDYYIRDADHDNYRRFSKVRLDVIRRVLKRTRGRSMR